jgi:hypothetical protein
MRNKNEKDLYIVYTAKHNGEVVYIGSGAYGREAHINSGCSHVYDINRLHFSGVLFCVEVVGKFATKQESIDREKILILHHKPIYNKMHNTEFGKSASMASIKNRWDKYFRAIGGIKGQKYRKALYAALDYFGWRNLKQGIDIRSLTIRNLPNDIRASLDTSREVAVWKEYIELMVVNGVWKLPEKTPVEMGVVQEKPKFKGLIFPLKNYNKVQESTVDVVMTPS